MFILEHGQFLDARVLSETMTAILKTNVPLTNLFGAAASLGPIAHTPEQLAQLCTRIAAQLSAVELKMTNGNVEHNTDALVEALTESWTDAMFDFVISPIEQQQLQQQPAASDLEM